MPGVNLQLRVLVGAFESFFGHSFRYSHGVQGLLAVDSFILSVFSFKATNSVLFNLVSTGCWLASAWTAFMSFIVVVIQGESFAWAWNAKLTVVYTWVLGLLVIFIGTVSLAKHVHRNMITFEGNVGKSLPPCLQPLNRFMDGLLASQEDKADREKNKLLGKPAGSAANAGYGVGGTFGPALSAPGRGLTVASESDDDGGYGPLV
jgi:hypothetical protein